jgi:cellulose synthase/poly-beta-1,6-N-acetylglucosamine synthase-like glycosyltransferase
VNRRCGLKRDKLPFVTIQLPIFNEQFVIDRLIEACCRLDYPRDRFEIQVLDDSTDETVRVAKQIVDRYAAGFPGMDPQPIKYLHRTNRHGYKAGALDKGLDVARGELIAIFDADFVPPPEWVMQVVHHFADRVIGMVQTRWTHLNRNYSFLTQVEGDSAGRALCAGAWRTLARRRLLQLQRDGRDVAA